MTTMSSSLLEFILDLLSNDDEMEQFRSDPQKAMDAAGVAGCSVADVESEMKVLAGAKPVHMTKAAEKKVDDDKDHGDKDHGHRDFGHKDHGHDDHVTNHVTNNYTTNNDNGDHYDIHAKQAALNGGINVGDDVEGDLKYEPEGSFNENGSGVQINGEDASIYGDLNSAGGSGSTVNTGSIDNSTGDEITKVDVDANVVVGDNNDTQQQSDDAEQENEGGLVIDNPDLNLGRTEIIQIPDALE